MDEREVKKIMDQVVYSLRKAQYNPKAQLLGYLAYENENCITRDGNARENIQLVSKEQIKRYINKYL